MRGLSRQLLDTDQVHVPTPMRRADWPVARLKPGYIEFGVVCIHSAIVVGDTSASVNLASQLLLTRRVNS